MAGFTHFLIIAVEHYKNKPFTRVRWAQKDAEDLVAAWQRLGYHSDDFMILLNNDATKTAIEYHLKKIVGKVQKNDRIVIFFAGHGFSVLGDNVIAPVDAQYDALEDTCVSIDKILGYLKKAESERNLLFLDCCHSGFEPGEDIRDVTGEFLIDDLAYALKDEVYCAGFASCRVHEISNSHPKLQHGVWSHFLIEALSGNAKDIYEKNLLLSNSLQTYLRTNTADFVRNNTDDKRVQTPVIFGHFTDRFIIEDLTTIFDARDAARKAASFNMTSIVIFDTEEGDIKDLPHFVKRFHHVPDKVGRAENDFVQSKVGNLVKDEIDDMSVRIKDGLGYTRKEMTVECGEGEYYGSIETPDFTYTVEIRQSQDDPAEYIIKRSLLDVTNPDIINDKDFNEVFDAFFRELSFIFNEPIDTDKLIDRIEAKGKHAGVKLKYNPGDTSRVRVIFPDSSNEIVIEPYSINITVPRAASPAQLVHVYKETNKMLEGAKIQLIEGTR